MLIYDENNNIIENPDLTKGYLREETIIKPDATPIDNKEKFAWCDDDYLTIQRYILYTEEDYIRMKQQKVEELKSNLTETDYIAAKSMDKLLLLCSTPEEMSEVTTYYKDKYGQTIEQRQQWRNEINELNDEIRKEEKNARRDS